MNKLTHIEKKKLERVLGMDTGYVLDFTNRTFDEFFKEVVGVSIYDQRYSYRSNSKANRLRAFWNVASEPELIGFVKGIQAGWELYSQKPLDERTNNFFTQILDRLEGTGSAFPAGEKRKDGNSRLRETIATKLQTDLINLTSLSPQKRGYAFEAFLKQMFEAYGLSANASFRNTGEQIDGSFQLNHETYLLEAKWENDKTGVADLHTFEGKIRDKAAWSRGLFVSNSGFTDVGLEAFGRSKRTVCMSGLDLCEMLMARDSFDEVMAKKVRKAAETGRPFVPYRDL